MLDINVLKSHLETLVNKRNEIISSSLSDDEKEKSLAVFDKENDELNQSIDIYYRLVDFSVSTEIDSITQLLKDLNDGTVNLLQKFTPDLYNAVISKFSSNSGLSISSLCVSDPLVVSSSSSVDYSIIPFGGYLSLIADDILTLDSTSTSSFNVYINLKSFDMTFALSPSGFFHKFGTSGIGSRSVTVFDGSLKKPLGSVSSAPFTAHQTPFFLTFYNCTVFLSDGFYLLNHTSGVSTLNLRGVTIKKSSDFNGGKLIKTNGRMTDVIRYGVILDDGLTWDDLVDDITKINFIR